MADFRREKLGPNEPNSAGFGGGGGRLARSTGRSRLGRDSRSATLFEETPGNRYD